MDVSWSWEWKGGISDGPLLATSEDPGVPLPLMQWMALPGLKLWGGRWWCYCKAKHVKMPPALRSQKPIYVLPIQGNVRYLVGGKRLLNADSGVWATVCKELSMESFLGLKSKILSQNWQNLLGLILSIQKYIFSVTRRSRLQEMMLVSQWLTFSTLTLTWLMWPWWVMIP